MSAASGAERLFAAGLALAPLVGAGLAVAPLFAAGLALAPAVIIAGRESRS